MVNIGLLWETIPNAAKLAGARGNAAGDLLCRDEGHVDRLELGGESHALLAPLDEQGLQGSGALGLLARGGAPRRHPQRALVPALVEGRELAGAHAALGRDPVELGHDSATLLLALLDLGLTLRAAAAQLLELGLEARELRRQGREGSVQGRGAVAQPGRATRPPLRARR